MNETSSRLLVLITHRLLPALLMGVCTRVPTQRSLPTISPASQLQLPAWKRCCRWQICHMVTRRPPLRGHSTPILKCKPLGLPRHGPRSAIAQRGASRMVLLPRLQDRPRILELWLSMSTEPPEALIPMGSARIEIRKSVGSLVTRGGRKCRRLGRKERASDAGCLGRRYFC